MPPFGHTTQLRVFVDPDLLQYDEVWAADVNATEFNFSGRHLLERVLVRVEGGFRTCERRQQFLKQQ